VDGLQHSADVAYPHHPAPVALGAPQLEAEATMAAVLEVALPVVAPAAAPVKAAALAAPGLVAEEALLGQVDPWLIVEFLPKRLLSTNLWG